MLDLHKCRVQCLLVEMCRKEGGLQGEYNDIDKCGVRRHYRTVAHIIRAVLLTSGRLTVLTVSNEL